MALTNAQLILLKAEILADPVLSAQPMTPDGAFAIAAAMNLEAVPSYYAWRTAISESEVTSQTSGEGTTWSWSSYISRSVGEQNGWGRMFSVTGSVNASNPNIRQGMADIFSGGPGAAQRTHLLAVSKRKASRIEKLLATGNGALATPSTMTFEGALAYQEVESARALP